MPELKELIQKYLPQVLEHRHHIHQHPELTGQEKETAAYIAETLRSMGLKPVEGVGGYGVVALIEGRGPGKCVGLRADIDALPLTECTPAATIPTRPCCWARPMCSTSCGISSTAP